MNGQKIYQVDAFTDQLFGGNPAAICPLAAWLPDGLLQQIAMENNLAETAFYMKEKEFIHLRWFTPAVEVDLCGHATLATAYVLFGYEGYEGDTIRFHTRSGLLTVTRKGDLLSMDFPADEVRPVELFSALTEGFDPKPVKAFKGRTDYMLVYETERQIRELRADPGKIVQVPARGIIVTAKGEISDGGREVDFVSRFFAPQSGIDEDPVTGSAHTTLTPYWAEVLGKKSLNAVQLSARRGYLHCELMGDRVKISGYAKIFMKGEIVLG